MQVLQRDDLHHGGFAGLKEHRLVMDRRVWGRHALPEAWNGIGNFVYLADATFMPKGETRMHPHHEIDVITFMLKGRIAHEGSLEHGEMLENFDIQVQRAGGEGFEHNEVNPDDEWNRMLQLWVTPEAPGEPAGYKKYQPKTGEITRIYGGKHDQDETFAAKTEISVALLDEGQRHEQSGDGMLYLSRGSARINGKTVTEGDLIRGKDLELVADENCHVIIITTNP